MAVDPTKARSIFLRAIEEHPPNEWNAYLDAACGGDSELRRRAEALLGAHEGEDAILDHGIVRPAVVDSVRDHPKALCDHVGSLIGPYKLLEQIGEGGMGLVFMAEQAQPMRRKVALKVLKPGMDTRQVVARFDAERQAVALMNHPNIAQVFDAGATPTGRPYFVMELVRGVTITEFCDQRRLTTRQRLELFVTVCHAVQHAHQKGIIHRDLKPSNILVTLHDTVAVPKVIDFGIAKATTQPLTDRSLFTHFSQMIGTPLYMSPEQAEMNGLDVDTRSDVYSLGVLLYELLTGTTPFESVRLKQVGFDEMRRVIREEDPPRPSQRVSTLETSARSTLSEQRRTDARTFDSMLRGELDWIVIKALEKDRNRRYESASAFAADVQRYLDDEQVDACPPSMPYRMRKVARRNKVALVTTGLVAAALLIGTVISVWQAMEATSAHELAKQRLESEKQARHDAEIDRKKAESAERKAATEAAIAFAVNDFLQRDLLGQVDAVPLELDESIENASLTVREALDRAAARIGDHFQDQPLVEAKIRMIIGDAYGRLQENERAVGHLERAVALRQNLLDPNHPDLLTSLNRLASIYLGAGQRDKSIALFRRLLNDQQARHGDDSPEALLCLCTLAGAYGHDGQWDTSVKLLEKVLRKKRDLWGPTDPSTLGTMSQLARALGFQNQFEESLRLFEEVSVTICSRDGSMRNAPLMIYAVACQRAGKFDKADQLLHELIKQGDIRTIGTLSARNSYANAFGFLALNELLQHRYESAERLSQQAINQRRLETHRGYFWISVWGAALLGQHKYADAEPRLLQGYEGMKKQEHLLGANDKERLAMACEWLIRFYEATNQHDRARDLRDQISPKTKANNAD
jgi:serine/threonine protein kinase/tetratricopeptide (TPR) repeat protein